MVQQARFNLMPRLPEPEGSKGAPAPDPDEVVRRVAPAMLEHAVGETPINADTARADDEIAGFSERPINADVPEPPQQ
jgi:hypothetical protein